MKQKLAFGAFVGTAIGATFGYFLFDSIPAALGLGCSVAACIWGAQFGFALHKDDE